jgi:hypothetical protein
MEVAMLLDAKEDNQRDKLIDSFFCFVIDLTSPDELIDAFERIDRLQKEASSFKLQLINAITALSKGPTKTRRVRGERRRAKIEMPSDYWDQGVLKKVWKKYPKYREEALAIDRLRVRKREFEKILAMTGPLEWEAFRNLIAGANQGPSGNPRVTVER